MKERSNLLFVCTANYYRSRFAELYCNFLAERMGLGVRADSAGLEMARWRDYNPGELSVHALRELEAQGIEVAQPPRAPRQFSPSMLEGDVRLIAMSEVEHRPMMQRLFPEVLAQTEFWSVEDVEYVEPAIALRNIRESVARCLESYR
jgi:protein-tyrosine phosphatase